MIKNLKVICINSKNSSKLVKNGIYIATSLFTSYNGSTRRIHLENVGTYDIKNFRLLDGRTIENEPDFSLNQDRYLDVENKNYTGQIIQCTSNSCKSLKKDEIYFVESQINTKRKHTSYAGTVSYYPEIKFKIRGIQRVLSPYHFSEIPISDQRYVKLKNLKGERVKTGDQTRKFLLFSEKEKNRILFECLSKVLFDASSVEFAEKPDLTKMMLLKGGTYNLIEEDIKEFLQKNIKDLLEPDFLI